MNKHQIEEQIKQLEQQVRPIFKQRDLLNDQIIDIRKQIDELNQQIDQMELLKHSDVWSDESLSWLLEHGHHTSAVRYESTKKFLAEQCSGLLMVSGFYPDTNQACLQIALIKDDKQQVLLLCNILRKLLPHIKPIKGVKMISILEHNCSEYGSYTLTIGKNDEEFKIIKKYYSRESVQYDRDDLQDALEYISHNLYYDIKDV